MRPGAKARDGRPPSAAHGAVSTPGPEAEHGIARIVLTVFMPFAAGFFFSDLYRQINAVIAPLLIEDMDLSAAGLGLMTSVFFLSFTANQLPLGIMLDRFGPRRVQATQLLIAALGAVIFALGHSEAVLLIGRVLMGLGVSGGLMSSLKAITLWFPRERWPLMNGLCLAFGAMGAMAATAPVEALLDSIGWAAILPQMLAALGAVFALAGVGDVIGALAGEVIPENSVFVTVLVFCFGMALFTMIMGNAFAAFPVMAAAIGIPLLVEDYGGNPAVIGAVGMLAGFCGTLLTPMAANFNIVPAALLELDDQNGVIRQQIWTAIPLWGCNVAIIYLAGFWLWN